MWRPSEGAPKPDYLLKMISNMAANCSRVSRYSHPPSSAAHLNCVVFIQPPISQTGAIKHMIQFSWSTKDEMNKVNKVHKENSTTHATLFCVQYFYRVMKLNAILATLSVTQVTSVRIQDVAESCSTLQQMLITNKMITQQAVR